MTPEGHDLETGTVADWEDRDPTEDTIGWAHQPDGVDDYSLGKPIACDYCVTIWATPGSLREHMDERHPETRPIYVILLGMSPDGLMPKEVAQVVRLPWSPWEDSDWTIAWENFVDAERGTAVIASDQPISDEETLVKFVIDSDTDEVDWMLVKFGESGPDTLASGSAYYRPPIEEPGKRP